ncbi:heterokaryon incompatibility protein-domain-containing protein [Pisolithus croceorrhizus]|nr:heterokaryon incompatibility protein-domain-containing protein [Pisolithus croceorrhizus]
MKLLKVEDVLKREEDIQHAEVEYDIIKELGDKTVRYAILSHRWEVEVTFKEMTGLTKMDERKREEVRNRPGYQKIIKSCEQAMKDGYEWLWIDTCCIDKRSSAELSEAINSMYRWYQDAQVCYAYLNDVDESAFPTKYNEGAYGKSSGWPEWFTRGWTLQELLASEQLEFFNKNWAPIGNKRKLAHVLEDITTIPYDVLRNGLAGKRLSVAQIMSWAANRKTTRVEDRAYSLMGLFEVHMPMVYGEGKKAFQRLQLEIIRTSGDHSIFTWDADMPRTGSVLADDPSDFRDCGNIEKVEPDEFGDKLVEHIELHRLGNPWYMRFNSRTISTNPIHQCRLAWLRWRARALSHQLRKFTVSNDGIQVCLPVIPHPDSPSHFRAMLACGGRGLVSFDLVSSGPGFDKLPSNFANIDKRKTLKAYPKFRTLHLAHNQDVNEKRRKFTLDDKHASYHGFTRCGTYPHESAGDTVTLSSLTNGLVVVVYANKDAESYFAVGLGYYLGQGWVHIVCDEHLPSQDVHWANFGERAYEQMWYTRAEHARNMSKQDHARSTRNAHFIKLAHLTKDARFIERARFITNAHFIKDAHLPRSIWAARVVWGRWEADNFNVMVDVQQCPGCCDGPCGMTTTLNDWGGLGMPGLMNTVCRPYSLKLDGRVAQLVNCSGQRIELGDYGDCVDGILIRSGNIFEDMRILGFDHEDSAYRPVACHVSSDTRFMYHMRNQTDVAIAHHVTSHTHLALRQAKGISLPANEHFVLLLKAFSTRLR